ncbi:MULTISPECIES: hypothetical protein [unclassified Bradyrhizobium]|uniref:hypothetical protein n=1 Tax=unclassified Bradyrhizobium TaxID=2631580 RepID=UPI001FFB600B|nr:MULTISPECIES: hypothetical protein [unclassified Bradyrhizobium]MCK1483025.1 hypothetical protein [Bradyrhizobium sp. 193]MCK1504393.1 hypothetical protein [Bradyrhizobium sp. 18]UPK13873.1 hypothetical protein IVA93_12205 [Bradyrhizobium sp. 155]UPK17212.1 hypothetical protein IVA73_24195 [Bradyrhizobium sp. 131]
MFSPQIPQETLDRASGASQASSEAAAICFAAIFTCVMSATSAMACAIVRLPLGSPHWFVFVKSFLLLAGAVSCLMVLTSHRRHQLRTSHAKVVLSAIAIIFLPCLAWFGPVFADIIVYPILLGTIFLGLQRTIVVVRDMARRTSMLAVVCGCGAGIGYFFVVNSKGYATVLTPEQALTGLQHLDTLFHASIANMLVNSGHLSTGLDGLMPIKYHVLSHIWMACVGLWLGVTTLEAYYLAAQIIAIPLLFFVLIMAGLLLRRPAQGLTNGALVTLMPLLLLMVADLWGATSYLVSESYLVSLLLLLLAMPLLAEIADERSSLGPPLIALAIAGTLVLFAKISVGVILWGVVGYLLWRRLGLTLLNFIKVAAPIAPLVGLASVVSSPDAGTYVHALSPLSFVREYPRLALPNIAANLVLLYGAVRLWLAGSLDEKRLAEAFALFAMGSLVPALLLDIAGGSAFYFANVGTFVCIAFLTAYGAPMLERLQLRAFTPGMILLVIVFIALATNEKRRSSIEFTRQFQELRARAHVLAGRGDVAPLPTLRAMAALLSPAGSVRGEIGDDVRHTPGAQSIQTLLSLGAAQTHRTAVFVAPNDRSFWTNNIDCRGDSFFVPAILGVPMLKGLSPPEFKCGRDIYYTTSLYKNDAISEVAGDAQLCARASIFGLNTILVLSAPDEGRRMSCPVSKQ